MAKVESRRVHMVGTAEKKDMGSFFRVSEGNCVLKGEARRDQTADGLKGARNSIVEPAKRGVRRQLRVPWMWWSGRT